MNYLLDTHTFLWAVTSVNNLSENARRILTDMSNDIYVSAVSFWEISLKFSIGKLSLKNISPEDFYRLAIETGFILKDLTSVEASSYHILNANWHTDPFDKMLIWQAIRNEFTLISKDQEFIKYESVGLKTIW